MNEQMSELIYSFSIHLSCRLCKDGNHSCKLKCERTLFCGHVCGRPCHGSEKCPPCNKKCSVTCLHSKCLGKCSNVVSDHWEDLRRFTIKQVCLTFFQLLSAPRASKIVTGSVNIFPAALFVELHVIDCLAI